jgi:hypothetical protein
VEVNTEKQQLATVTAISKKDGREGFEFVLQFQFQTFIFPYPLVGESGLDH